MSRARRRHVVEAYLYMGPWLLGYVALTFVPVLLSLWASVGGTRMVIFLAGLQGVSEELYDAAKVDGAGNWARFRHITLPMLTPTIFFNLVLGIIGALQVFTPALVATDGGPAYAT